MGKKKRSLKTTFLYFLFILNVFFFQTDFWSSFFLEIKQKRTWKIFLDFLIYFKCGLFFQTNFWSSFFYIFNLI